MVMRGTTPTHTFKTDVDLTAAEVIYLTYKQQGRVLIEKTIDDMDVYTDSLVVKLKQKDTLKLNDRLPVRMQIRARFEDGTAIACKVIEAPAYEILKEGEI